MQSSWRALVPYHDSGWEKRWFLLRGLVCVALEFTWTSDFRDASRNEHTDLFPSCFVLGSSQSHKQDCLTNLNHLCITMQLVAKGTFKNNPQSLCLDLELNVFNIFLLSWVGTSDFFPFFSPSECPFLPSLADLSRKSVWFLQQFPVRNGPCWSG